MTKKIYVIFYLMLLFHAGFTQDTIQNNEKKIQMSFNIGASFKGFFGSGYVDPTPYSYGESYDAHQFDRFTKIPAFGFLAGVLFTFNFSKHWGIAGGISYIFRKTIYENNQDTVNKYSYSSNSMQNLHNVVKYNYSYNNLELPIVVQYKLNKFTVYAGFQLSVLSYRSATYTYLMNQYAQNTGWYTSEKTIRGFETTFRVYPTIKINYDLKIKTFLLKPFIGIEFFEINLKDFYLHIQTSPFYIYSSGPSVENCYFLNAGIIFPVSLY